MQQSGSSEDTWTGTIRNIEGEHGPHVHLAEPGPADLRVGRQDGRRDRGAGRRLQLPRHRHRPGRQRGQRPARQHHHRHPAHAGPALDRPVVLLSERGRGEGHGDLRPERARDHGDREVDPRRPGRAGPDTAFLQGHREHPGLDHLGRQGRQRARRCPRARTREGSRSSTSTATIPTADSPVGHHQADRSDRRGEGGVRRLLADGRQQREHGGDLPGHLLGAVLDRHDQGQRRQGREDPRVARQGGRQVRMGRPRR